MEGKDFTHITNQWHFLFSGQWDIIHVNVGSKQTEIDNYSQSAAGGVAK